jgi:hypothetical protein
VIFTSPKVCDPCHFIATNEIALNVYMNVNVEKIISKEKGLNKMRGRK